MPPLTLRPGVALAASAFFLLTAASHAAMPFGHTIRKNDPALPDFNSAGLVTHESIAGAVFFASMDFPDGEDTYAVNGFGYFDQNAAFKWAAYVDTGPLAGSDPGASGPLPGNPAKYFAIYNVAGGKTRVGVGTGSTLGTDFAVEFTHTADPDHVTNDITADNKILQLMDFGPTLGLVSFTATGSLDISKNYASPLLLPAGSTQYAEIAAIPGGTGYYLTVQNSTNGLTQTFLVIKLDTSGAVLWSRTFAMTTTASGSLSPSPLPAPDGSFLLSLAQSDFVLGQKTHLVKFNANGTKAWSNTISGGALQATYFSPNSNDIWLTGSKLDFTGEPLIQPLAVRVANATGAVSAEFRPSGGDGIIMSAVNADAAYFNIIDSDFPNRSTIAKVATGTSTVQGFVRNDTFGGFAFISMRDTTGSLSSEFSIADKVVRAIGYNTAFQSVVAICPDYATTTIPLLTPALTSAALTLDPATVTVTASARTTTTTNLITLPIHPLALKIDPYSVSTGPLNLRVTTTRNAAGNLVISFTAQAGVKYTLLYSPDLVTAFTPVQTLTGTGVATNFTVTNLSAGKGFFKISDE